MVELDVVTVAAMIELAVLAGIGVGQLPVGKHRVRSAAAQS